MIINGKQKVLTILLVFSLLSIPVFKSLADQAEVELKYSASFETVDSNYYDIRENKYSDLESDEGKLRLTFKENASLQARLNPTTTSLDLDTDHLKLHLAEWEDTKWVGLSQDKWEEVESFESRNNKTEKKDVFYRLKYELSGIDTPYPNKYDVGLEFRLVGDSEDDFTISVFWGEPGPGESVVLSITDETGWPVSGVKVEVNGNFKGTTSLLGLVNVEFPEDSPAIVTARQGNDEATREFTY